MAKPMTLEGFRKLERRDFENGAVLDEIAAALKDREALIVQIERERQAAKAMRDYLDEIAAASAPVTSGRTRAGVLVNRYDKAVAYGCHGGAVSMARFRGSAKIGRASIVPWPPPPTARRARNHERSGWNLDHSTAGSQPTGDEGQFTMGNIPDKQPAVEPWMYDLSNVMGHYVAARISGGQPFSGDRIVTLIARSYALVAAQIERERQAARKLLDILHRCPRRECHGVGGQTIDASLSRMRVHDVPWRAVLDFEEVLAGEEGDDD